MSVNFGVRSSAAAAGYDLLLAVQNEVEDAKYTSGLWCTTYWFGDLPLFAREQGAGSSSESVCESAPSWER